MARIPDQETLGERPSPRPNLGFAQYRGDNPMATAPADAAIRMGGQLVAAGREIEQTFRIEQEKADTTRVEDAWNQYKGAALEVTSGEGGVLNLKAGDAVNGNIVKTVKTKLEEAKTRIKASLASDEQRARFDSRALTTDIQVGHQTLAHLAQENREYQKQVIMGSEAAAKSQITAAPTNQDVFEGAKETLLRQANAFLKNNGVTDKDAQKAYKDKITDGLWESRIDALLYGQPVLADAMFRANQDQIKDPLVRLKLQNKTREVALGVDSDQSAERIVRDFRDKTPPAQSAPITNVGQTGKNQTGDEKKLAILVAELNDPEASKNRTEASTKELGNEITKLYKKVKPGGGEVDIATLGKGSTNVAMKTEAILAPNTSGLPLARDIAAQLPLMETRVEKMADEKYGPDRGNPDRAAWVKRTTSALHAKVASEVQALNAIQKQAQGQLIDAILGVGQATGGVTAAGGTPKGITALSQIISDPVLGRLYQQVDPGVKPALINLMKANLETGQGDEKLYWETWNRIHLLPGDPRKIDFYQQILEFAGPGKLSVKQIGELRLEIDRDETPGGRSVNKMKVAASTNVGQWFKTNIMFTGQPERAIAANMRWNEEVGKKVDALVAAGTPELVRNLFLIDSKESVVNPKYLQSFVDSTPAQGVAQQAEAARAASPIQQPATIKTRAELDAWFETLPPTQTTFVGTDGKTYKVPARAEGATPTTMTPTGQLVTPTTVSPGTQAGPAGAVPAAAAKQKSDIPAFVSNKGDPEAQRLHQEALWEAVKSIPKGVGAVVAEAAAAPLIAAGRFAEWLGDLPAKNRREHARGAFQFVLKKDSFNELDIQVIQGALKWGELTYDERKKAKAMLKAAGVE